MTGHVIASMDEAISNDFSFDHQAVDIVKSGGNIDDIIAFGDGTVEIVVNDFKYTDHNTSGTATYGNFIKINHDNGIKTLYAHLKYNSIDVFPGQRVSKGQRLATMGSTGNAYGAHLHFEVRDSSDRRLNPKDFLYKEDSLEEVMETDDVETDSDESIEEIVVNSESLKENQEFTDKNGFSNVLTSNTDSLNVVLEKVKQITPDYTNKKISYLDNEEYDGGSLVDALNAINIDSSFDERADIALKNGVDNYRGTYLQNVFLLSLLKEGKLVY